MGGRRWLVSMIGAVSGVCFAALAAGGIGVLVITPLFDDEISHERWASDAYRQIKISEIGTKSGCTISIPVWRRPIDPPAYARCWHHVSVEGKRK